MMSTVLIPAGGGNEEDIADFGDLTQDELAVSRQLQLLLMGSATAW